MDVKTDGQWKEKIEAFYLACISGTANISTPKTDDCKEDEAASNDSDYSLISKYAYIG